MDRRKQHSKSTRPKTINARRPETFRDASNVEKACTKGLNPEYTLALEQKKGKITLTSWVEKIREYIEDCGMDTVFRIWDAKTEKEIYLLKEWGEAADMTRAKEWTDQLRKGLTTKTGTKLDACEWDHDNLNWSKKGILASIDLEMQEMVEKDLRFGASGVEVLSAVILKQQQVTATSVRVLVNELEALTLSDQPGQDVELFGNLVIDKARRIEGTGFGPPDLAVLVAKTFVSSDSLSFNIEANSYHSRVDKDPKSMSWETIVFELKNKYRALLGQKMWDAAKGLKKAEDRELAGMKSASSELTGLTAAIKQLTQQGYQGGGQQNTNNVVCFNCGKPGHFARNCPEAQDGQRHGQRSWKKIPPGENEPAVKLVDGVEWKYCGRCRRWTSGTTKHSTEEHKTRAELQSAGAPSPEHQGDGSTRPGTPTPSGGDSPFLEECSTAPQ